MFDRSHIHTGGSCILIKKVQYESNLVFQIVILILVEDVDATYMMSTWIMNVYFMILRINSCLKALTHPLKQLQKHWNKLAISAISLDQRWKEPGYAAKQKVCVLGQPHPESTWNKGFTWKIHKWIIYPQTCFKYSDSKHWWTHDIFSTVF